MNPLYANKELRDKLGKKSKKAFGARNRWRKHAERKGWSLEKVETMMDEIIKLTEESINVIRKQNSDISTKETDNQRSREVAENGSIEVRSK